MIAAQLQRPYLLFLGDASSDLDAKTGHGLSFWRRDDCVGQLRLAHCRADTGLPDMDIEQALASGARSLVIAVAPSGGAIKADWVPTLVLALESGLDVISGMHTALSSVSVLSLASARSGARLVDVRVAPRNIPLATGKRRSGKRVLMVGTDCCVGKKYTALALHRAMLNAEIDTTFRATGQTGIMIAGEGIPMDAVVSDFLPGAAEMLSPDNEPDHWDVIEGQGSLFHPAYAAVCLGLLHGSQADALILCHQAGRAEIDDYPGYAIPALRDCIAFYLDAAKLTNPDVRFAGLSINTRHMGDTQRQILLTKISDEAELPCVDPLATGVRPLLDSLLDVRIR